MTVCTGNVARSPAAERLLTALAWPDVVVSSAGTAAVVGAPIIPPMAGLLAADGAPTAGFQARQLTADLIKQADLVLAMTPEHRAAVVNLCPTAIKYTFTLLEFARIAGLTGPALGWPQRGQPEAGGAPAAVADDAVTGPAPSQRLARLMTVAPAWRPWARPPAGESDAVPDPYGRADTAFVASYTLIRQAVGQIDWIIRPRR